MNQELYYLIKDIEAAALKTGHTFQMCRIGAEPVHDEIIAELHAPYNELAELLNQLIDMADKAKVAA